MILFPERRAIRPVHLDTTSAEAVGEEPFLNRMAAYLLRLAPSSELEAHYDSDDCGCNVGDDWCGGGSHCCGDSGCQNPFYSRINAGQSNKLPDVVLAARLWMVSRGTVQRVVVHSR
jgi:hypothetical protein